MAQNTLCCSIGGESLCVAQNTLCCSIGGESLCVAQNTLCCSIGGESLCVAQNTYAVGWFKDTTLNTVFGLQLSFSRVVSMPLTACKSHDFAKS